MKATRVCLRCKIAKPPGDYARPTARRCEECAAKVARGGTCRNCGDRTGVSLRGKIRVYCDAQVCQTEKASAATRGVAEKRRQARAARTHATCPACAETLPLTLEWWAPSTRDGDEIVRLDSYCRGCRSALQRDHYRTSEAVRLGALRRALEQRARENERRAADQEFDASWRDHKNRLARERNQRKQRKIVNARRVDSGVFPPLPARPLAEAIVARVGDGDLQSGCLGAGTDVRNVSAWLSGERPTVTFDVADRVLGALGLMHWEVWADDPVVAAVWEGEVAA